jgi:hypothetical protein
MDLSTDEILTRIRLIENDINVCDAPCSVVCFFWLTFLLGDAVRGVQTPA